MKTAGVDLGKSRKIVDRVHFTIKQANKQKEKKIAKHKKARLTHNRCYQLIVYTMYWPIYFLSCKF